MLTSRNGDKVLDMDWIVTTYDAEDNIIESWTICNRTESQAEKEAMSDPALHNVADWSMMPEGWE